MNGIQRHIFIEEMIMDIMNFVSNILENPIYIFLFGGGGILAVIVAVTKIIFSKDKHIKHADISVSKSEETEICKNDLKGTSIKVDGSKHTIISNNK